MNRIIANMGKRSVFLFFVYLSMVLAIILLLTMYVRATSIGTNVTVSGNTTLGDTAASDTITVTARLAADLDPNTNNTIDLGTFGLAYNNIYVSSTAHLSYVSSTAMNVSGSLSAQTNNGADLGAFDLAWNDIFASGTTYVAALTIDGNTTVGNATSDTLTVTARLAADLNPNANNTIDLGTFGLAYNNIYVSSTAHLNYVSSTAMNVSGSLSSLTNNGADLGEFGLAWNDIFASGTTYVAGLTIDGNTTVGNATSDTITINARLAADLDPNANNTIDLGQFDLAYNNIFVSSTSYLGSVTSTMINPWANNTSDLGNFGNAWRDVYVSSTAFVGDLSDLLYVDKVNSRIGISSSTPSAILSIGTVNTTSTLDVPQLCFRTTIDIGGTDTQVYYWPCTGAACPTVAMDAAGWATSTASCF